MSQYEEMDLNQLKDAFKLNIGNDVDRMLDVVTGRYRAPQLPGEPDRITKHIKESQGWHDHAQQRQSRYSEIMAASAAEGDETGTVNRSAPPVSYNQAVSYAAAPKLPAKYAQLMKELERITFSDDEEKFNKQMEAAVGGIRKAMQELVIKDVAANTRQTFGEHVSEVFQVGGGLKVDFVYDGKKYSVSARGPFTGDETVCLHRKGDKLVGSVLRIDENGKTDLTSNFGITIGE